MSEMTIRAAYSTWPEYNRRLHDTLAGTRLTLAPGAAILIAPFVLGVAADAAGVPVAWGLVVVLSLVALAADDATSVAASIG